MESIISQLSSQLKVNSNEPNKIVAQKCIDNPVFLEEIASGMDTKDKKLIADCAEVMTEVALIKPELILKFSEKLISLLVYKETRIRWEAMHSIALSAPLSPEFIQINLGRLVELIHKDSSVIVRDYALDAVINFACSGRDAAEKSFLVIREALEVWQEKHAGRILEGLVKMYAIIPNLKDQFISIADVYKDSSRAGIRKSAVKLDKIINK